MPNSLHLLYRLTFQDLILFEDEDLLALNKPAGACSLDLRNQPNTGLLSLARQYYPQLTICHRLDQYTTGVLLFAKHHDAFKKVALQFEHRQIQKQYMALVAGQHNFDQYVVDAPLSSMSKGKVNVDFFNGKYAETWLYTSKVFRQFTLVAAKPITGRSHQIRVHLASIGCPIVGDLLYGGNNLFLSSMKQNYRSKSGQEERPLNTSYLLHAEFLELIHPRTNQHLKLSAPLPKNFSMCIRKLESLNAMPTLGS
jgi:23S rRNA pseudouridine955/2504/2580 synthase